ncbi:HNH endonuclease, partial [Paenarthrobacter sp. TAF1]
MPRPSLDDGKDALLLAQTALGSYLDDASEALVELGSSVAADARLFGFGEAADFAGRVEDLSRQLEYVQVVAAQAVERTRTEAQRAVPAQQPGQTPASSAQEWRTGWTEPAGESEGGVGGDSVPAAAGGGGSVLDDGYRNAAEFLRARLRIGIGEARRRLALANEVLPGAGITGQEIPARRQRLAEALHTGQVPSRSATIISTALDKAQHFTDPDTLTGME